ncbi:aspartyl-tRNA(Asn)/glutamyl-tRNA(Gln) amidotransferase subunit A [Variovorax boronicumulans]|uniref:amidase n=1 Tax=Variovorax boronicumulans TaxID=436515 RepID=UPI0027858C61|nr:amidase [Variovorax boronicumulans]MDP9993507.1 aspartyl-tRNA(Asn)/glutamyl-tRNA(Gln) amidotransferase subunit A [Variovorax boronicumulans]MDQ0004626.1 aspartyl-tRNA(Asn)/glutamyl-tRNA(Gln) amidotransferase subunit A [Variovorax boronicumulans]
MNDLHAARLSLQAGGSDARTEIERAIEISQSPACAHVFTRTMFDEARQGAAEANPQSRLAGLAFTSKDLFDIDGQPTPAGSVVLSHAPAAKADAIAVARLRAAGGVLTGRTNMSEFAFSGVGVNPHHGTPINVSDNATPRIPGGSSSGAAISVASGAAFIGLGSDTGGSIRIPAALNGIVGFKNTARLVPADGALPLSTTLDTVCAMTRSVRDAITAHEILSARLVTAGTAPLATYRLAVVKNVFFDGIEPAVAAAFERTLNALRSAGARIDEIELPELADLQSINATGGFSAAESHAWHRLLLERSGAGYDPRVAQRIVRGATMKAHEYIDLINARRAWIARVETALASFDAVLSPTVPITAPSIASVAPGAERDDEFFRVNALLLRNPSIVNMLDGCALSLPCHAAGQLPVGLMLWHAALHDDAVLAIALQVERALQNQ